MGKALVLCLTNAPPAVISVVSSLLCSVSYSGVVSCRSGFNHIICIVPSCRTCIYFNSGAGCSSVCGVADCHEALPHLGLPVCFLLTGI